jgi:16S rRNA G966 N2-methylase RsmD
MALSAKKYPDVPVAYVARQIEALGKIRRKIPSWYREGMEFPVALSIEQASSEATAIFKSNLFSGGSMADLTGGLGVDASFFARQFDKVFYVERNQEIFSAARYNMAVLGLQHIALVLADSEQFLIETDHHFDLIYLDPARRDERKGKVFQLADCSPNILEIKDLLWRKTSKILLKTAPLLDIQQAMQQLKHVTKVWVLEYEGDCREVLYLLENKATNLSEQPITAISIDKKGQPLHIFDSSIQQEQQAELECSAPMAYLYEPFPSILKIGAFKSFAKRFGLQKLHVNTHLYTSETFVPNLPARSFHIEAICKYDKNAVKSLIPEGRASISTRNFPETADQVRKKLGLQDGGDNYIFASTDIAEKKILILCHKVKL